MQRIARKVEKGIPFTEEILNYTKSGDPYWLKMEVTPITDEEGNITRFFSIQEDITRQVEKEQQLKRERDRLKEAQKIGKIGDWFFDASTEQITWSEAVYKIYERDPQQGPPSYNELFSYVTEETGQRLRKSITRALSEGIPYSFDAKIFTDKGNEKFVHLEGIPIKNENGEVTQLHGIAQDITERKEAQQELQEKEAQLRNIANNIDGMVHRYRLYPDGSDDFIFVSEGVEDLHEVTSQQLMESPELLWSQIVDDHLDRVRQSVHQSADQLTPWDEQWKIETPSGQHKWIHGRGTPQELEDGTVQWDTIVLDITDQKELEKNISRQVSLLNNIIDSIPGLFYMVGEDLTFVRTNENVKTFFDLSKKELQTTKALTVVAPRERNNVQKTIQQVFEEGYADTETVLIDADGKEHHFFMTGNHIEIEGNSYLIGMGIDITERVEAEEENMVLMQEVHHRVKNNLAIISGILTLELQELPEASSNRLPLERSINRITNHRKSSRTALPVIKLLGGADRRIYPRAGPNDS
ncbi:MAG: PAS domain S-box protein [Fodinibius sp.]|nr:PAS domain S-box protein [Fodinibius sp.]